jgi:hypothetical protein
VNFEGGIFEWMLELGDALRGCRFLNSSGEPQRNRQFTQFQTSTSTLIFVEVLRSKQWDRRSVGIDRRGTPKDCGKFSHLLHTVQYIT